MKTKLSNKSNFKNNVVNFKTNAVERVKNHSQLSLIQKTTLAYGGELLKTRAGRASGRPLDTKNTMHLVLRSSKAKGDYSMRKPGHSQKVKKILERFSKKYGIKIISFANVGNHLHLHIKIALRSAYKPFIRAITAAIAMAITGASRWKTSALGKFWDYRPFTRVVVGWRAVKTLRDYIHINQWEGMGVGRAQARVLLNQWQKHRLEI